MTETQNTPTPDQDTPDTPDAPTPDQDAPDAPDSGDVSGYAVYDETLVRYIGGVHARKADADKARKLAPKGHTTKVHKV